MKKKDLVKLLKKNGWELVRHGNNHDIYQKGDRQESIGRHTELNENLAKAIIKRQGLK